MHQHYWLWPLGHQNKEVQSSGHSKSKANKSEKINNPYTTGFKACKLSGFHWYTNLIIPVHVKLWMLYLLFSFSESLQGPHERRLLNDLLKDYNILERPVFNESNSLSVSFGLTLQQIIDVVSDRNNTFIHPFGTHRGGGKEIVWLKASLALIKSSKLSRKVRKRYFDKRLEHQYHLAYKYKSKLNSLIVNLLNAWLSWFKIKLGK